VRQPPPAKGDWFDVEELKRLTAFFGLLRHTKGVWAGKPFELLPWQRDLLGALLCWKRADGTRRFRSAYIEIPRKNGKSTLLAAIGLYMLLCDHEQGAEVYCCASARDQAAIVGDACRQMVQSNPELAAKVEVFRNVITFGTSKLEVLSSDAGTKHGKNASCVIFDEVHTFADRDLYDAMVTSMGARQQPLQVCITTAGHDRESLCWELHDYAAKVRDRIIDDPGFMPVLFSAPVEADWKSPKVWRQCNPSLGVTVSEEFLRAECEKAKELPTYETTFRQLYLCQWTESKRVWISSDAWAACASSAADADSLQGRECWGGLDLSTTTDLSSLALVFPASDGSVDVLTWTWCPEEGIRRRSRTRPSAVRRVGQQGPPAPDARLGGGLRPHRGPHPRRVPPLSSAAHRLRPVERHAVGQRALHRGRSHAGGAAGIPHAQRTVQAARSPGDQPENSSPRQLPAELGSVKHGHGSGPSREPEAIEIEQHGAHRPARCPCHRARDLAAPEAGRARPQRLRRTRKDHPVALRDILRRYLGPTPPRSDFEDTVPIGQATSGAVQSYVQSYSYTGEAITPARALEAPSVYACVRLIASSISRLEWQVLRETPDGKIAEPAHPLHNLLNYEASDDVGAIQLREKLLTDCLLTGNAYAYIHRDPAGRPVALEALRPDYVAMYRDPQNQPYYQVWTGRYTGTNAEKADASIPGIRHVPPCRADHVRRPARRATDSLGPRRDRVGTGDHRVRDAVHR
jgi:hypothetical protein